MPRGIENTFFLHKSGYNSETTYFRTYVYSFFSFFWGPKSRSEIFVAIFRTPCICDSWLVYIFESKNMYQSVIAYCYFCIQNFLYKFKNLSEVKREKERER